MCHICVTLSFVRDKLLRTSPVKDVGYAADPRHDYHTHFTLSRSVLVAQLVLAGLE